MSGLLLGLLHVLKAIGINFYVNFPIRLLFVNFFDDLVAKIIVSLDHDKSITKSIESSSLCISFDDSERIKNKLPDVSHLCEFAEGISDKRFRD